MKFMAFFLQIANDICIRMCTVLQGSLLIIFLSVTGPYARVLCIQKICIVLSKKQRKIIYTLSQNGTRLQRMTSISVR